MSELTEAIGVLREWQHAEAPMQLHPGDLGWFQRFGPRATAAALRTWRRDGRIVAMGLQDGPSVLRLTFADRHDEALARRVAVDLDGKAAIEAPTGAAIHGVLLDDGWQLDEAWTPLRRDLAAPVADPGVRIDVVGPENAQVRVALQRASFNDSKFTEEHWHAMAASTPYADARCLLAYDGPDAVAMVTVWSAGPGRPGVVEPMGVHREHRAHGYGKAITLAGAAALRELGSSSAVVYTPSTNAGAIATYRSAGFEPREEMRDLSRPADDGYRDGPPAAPGATPTR